MGARALKKALFVTHVGSLQSGAEISNQYLMVYLKRHGWDVKIIFPNWGDGSNGERFERLGIESFSLDYSWWDKHKEDIGEFPAVNTKSVEGICDIIRDFDPGVVVTNTTVVPWAAFAAALMNKPHVWVVRELPIQSFAWIGEKMDFIEGYSNIVMANSKMLAKFLRDQYGLPTTQFYSFVDTSNLKLNEEITTTRLVSPNYIDGRKNQIELIKALAILKKAGLRPQVLLIGGSADEQYMNDMLNLIREGGLQESVEIVDFTDNPWGLVGENDIVVQTSLSESIGRTTTEAMKLGLVLIASDIPGHVENVGLGGGMLYKSGDANDLARKIRYAVENIDELKKEAVNAKARALKNTSEDACSGPFLAALESVIGEGNPRRELAHLRPYLSSYVRDRESTIESLRVREENLMALVESLRNSASYKLGNRLVRAAKGVTKSLNYRRNAKKSIK